MSPKPTDIKLLQKAKTVDFSFDDGKHFTLSCFFLRQHSPAADANLQAIDENVNIISIDLVGHYAVKFIFDDGHDTGIYTWEYLYKLGQQL